MAWFVADLRLLVGYSYIHCRHQTEIEIFAKMIVLRLDSFNTNIYAKPMHSLGIVPHYAQQIPKFLSLHGQKWESLCWSLCRIYVTQSPRINELRMRLFTTWFNHISVCVCIGVVDMWYVEKHPTHNGMMKIVCAVCGVCILCAVCAARVCPLYECENKLVCLFE